MVKIIKTTDVIVDNRAEEDAKEFWKQFDNMQDKINNLQSKINKANEILNRPQFEYDNIPCNYEEDIKELKDILKEK